VYEGLTQYLGVVLTARSGLWTPEQFRDYLAWAAEWAGNQRGRAWRPLDDTAAAAQLLFYARGDWASWRRGVDFYDEGLLLWLDIDTLIREKTGGKKSLDDFCRRFHAGKSGPPQVRTFTLEDVVADLNAVVAHDWKGLLQKRVASPAKEPPLDGITRGGWKLTYGEKQTDLHEANDGEAKLIDLASSVGLVLKEDGTVADVVPGRSAHKAGVGPGMKLIAVNSRRYSAALLREALKGTAKGGKLELLLENGEFFRTYALKYDGGARFPRLERDAGRPDHLAAVVAPLAKK
jgi:predicted metalloprotease with PDZ domain